MLDSPGEVAEPQMEGIHDYDVGMILTAVQEAGDVVDARLIRLEINFLSMLGDDREGEPATLFRKLATEPAFFVDILSSCYRSTLKQSDEEVNELKEDDAKQRALAHIGHELLYKWKSLPGTNNDGTVDEQELWKWANSAREIAEPLGYLDTCDFRIGQLISHGPTDSDGSWPARSVRRVVEKISTERIGAGIYIGIINSRGIVCRGEGGAQERDLATKYKTFAEQVRVDAPFTASVLDRICAYYLGEGREWDNRDEWER